MSNGARIQPSGDVSKMGGSSYSDGKHCPLPIPVNARTTRTTKVLRAVSDERVLLDDRTADRSVRPTRDAECRSHRVARYGDDEQAPRASGTLQTRCNTHDVHRFSGTGVDGDEGHRVRGHELLEPLTQRLRGSAREITKATPRFEVERFPVHAERSAEISVRDREPENANGGLGVSWIVGV